MFILRSITLTGLVFLLYTHAFSMMLTTLGTGTSIPLAQRGLPANLLQYGGKNILIDCGAGALAQLAKKNLTVRDIDTIFITHFHIDHIGDLPTILQSRVVWEFDACDLGDTVPLKPLTIYAPRGMQKIIESYQQIHGCFAKPKSCIVEEFDLGASVKIDDLIVSPHKVLHTPESVGYSFIAQGKKLVITGDCQLDADLLDLLSAADTAVIECSYSDEFAALVPHVHHLSPKGVAQAALTAGVKNVIVTHLYPCADALDIPALVNKTYPGTCVVAADGKTFIV